MPYEFRVAVTPQILSFFFLLRLSVKIYGSKSVHLMRFWKGLHNSLSKAH